MRPFTYERARDEASAVAAGSREHTRFIAGGTTLVDLMRLDVERPGVLVDVTGLPLAAISPAGDGVRIGALARNSDVAAHPLVVERYPLLRDALLAGASSQVRNMATVGGNLLQRTRCPYFRDPSAPCNKRDAGSGCSAWDGYNRSNAVLGGSEHCIATNPSDMCVALVALDAVVRTRTAAGERAIAMGELHVVPGDRPDLETILAPGELVTAVELPPSPYVSHSRYVKVRDRASFDFALASVAVGLEMRGDKIASARIALGGVATKPWRCIEAERILVGRPPGAPVFRAAAEASLRGASPRAHNAFKVELAKRAIVRALSEAAGTS